MDCKEITLKYFNSWQEPADFEELSTYLADDFRIDAGAFSFNSKREFVQFLKSNPAPWKEVKLLSSIYSENKASILYEGINTVTGERIRVSEHIRIVGDKIAEIYTVIAKQI